MNPTIAARISVTMRNFWQSKKLDADRVRELHASGLSDAAAARVLNCATTTFNNYRRGLGLPRNEATYLATRAIAGRLGTASRVRRRAARAAADSAALNLPLTLEPMAIRVVETLAAGPLTRAKLAPLIGVSAGRSAKLIRILPGLRKQGVVIVSGGGHDKPSGRMLPFVWSLAPPIAATFSSLTLSPLQQRIAAQPRALAVAEYHTNKYAAKLPHLRDDIHSAAMEGITDAALRFNPLAGNQFISFATRRVQGAIQDALRAAGLKGYRRDADTAPQLLSGATGLHPFSDAASHAPDTSLPIGWELESLDALDAIIHTLSSRDQNIIRLYFGHGLTMKQISTRLKYSPAYISKIYQAALANLRDQFVQQPQERNSP